MKYKVFVGKLLGLLFFLNAYGMQNDLQRADFFSDITGWNENQFINKYGWQKGSLGPWIEANRVAWIKENPRRAAIFQGMLKVETIEDMDKQITQKGFKNISGKNARFTILVFDPNNPQATDVRAMQADPMYKNAVFQLASTFWGPLEGGMMTWQTKLEDMLKHAVQGEEASISTAGATIWRKYFMPAANKQKKIGDPFTGYYYLLFPLVKKIPVYWQKDVNKNVTGYSIDEKAIQNYQYDVNDIKRVMLAIHQDIVVTSGYGQIPQDKTQGTQEKLPVYINNDGTVDIAQTQIISQVFTSALNTINLRKSKLLNKNVIDLSKMLLRAAYEGTVKLAYLANKSTVILTLVGGGAFRNDMSWIAEALENPDFKDFIKKTGMQVTLVFYPDKVRDLPVRTAQGDYDFFARILPVIDSVNSTHVSGNDELHNAIKQYLNAAYAQKNSIVAQQAPVINKLLSSGIQQIAPITIPKGQIVSLTQKIQEILNDYINLLEQGILTPAEFQGMMRTEIAEWKMMLGQAQAAQLWDVLEKNDVRSAVQILRNRSK